MSTYIPIDFNTESLPCAGCGDANGTHMDAVEMHSRPNGEDGEVVVLSVTAKGHITARPGNGRGRRHSIVLKMTCEMCAHMTELEFMQRKGQTQVEYR